METYRNARKYLVRLLPAQKGFTFVEAMVVLALAAVIGASLASSFILGMRAWKRATQMNYIDQKALIGLERLCSDVRQVFNDTGIPLTGRADFLEFATISDDKIWHIVYAYSAPDMALLRQRIPKGSSEAENVSSRKMLTGATNFTLHFLAVNLSSGNLTSQETWNSTISGLPLGVKVSVALTDGVTYEKTVVIPAAQ